MFRRSPDFWSGLALAALGAYILGATRGWEYLSAEGPGPAFFPRWYAIAMIVLGAALAIGSTKPSAIDWRGATRAFAMWAALAIAVLLMKFVGFALGFALLTIFVVAVMYRRPVSQAALVAGVMVAIFYLVFPVALGVPLP
ncbi:MAG: tripartite tricarboxylate transporter TctB family protein [Burkholderiales bacterium]